MPTKTYLIPKSNLKVFEQGFQRMNELASIFAAEPSERYNLRGKVKGHETFEGVKETLITRVRVK
jgi:hypothetical protein